MLAAMIIASRAALRSPLARRCVGGDRSPPARPRRPRARAEDEPRGRPHP